MAECAHPMPMWYAAINEDGWKCLDCGTQLGFRPDLDRAKTFDKVEAILMALHEAKLVYISNGTEGGIVAANVATRCQLVGHYDQYSILRFILSDPNVNGHMAFWRAKADEWFAAQAAADG